MSKRRGFFWLVLVASLFGPYLTGGIRTDQVVIYSAAVAAALLAATGRSTSRVPALLALGLFAWAALVTVAAAGLLGHIPAQWAPGSAAAGMDNLLAPLAVALIVVVLATPAVAPRVLRQVAGLLAVAAAANGALSLAQTRVDLNPVLRPFWGVDSATVTVSELAGTMGRFSGIFNQPAEAGLMYGLGGLCAVYVWAERPRLLYPTLALVFIGGVLCVSKVFLLIGAPLILWQVWRLGRQKVTAVAVLILAALALRQFGFAQWAGLDYALRLLNPPDVDSAGGLMSFYTAGRLGTSSSTLGPVVDEVLQQAPLGGFGARGLSVPYDNGWVEALVVAGLVGAVAYTVTLACWAWMALRLSGRPHKPFALAVVALAVGASFGLPALTANRVGAALWLVVVLLGLVLVNQRQESQAVQTPRAAAARGARRSVPRARRSSVAAR